MALPGFGWFRIGSSAPPELWPMVLFPLIVVGVGPWLYRETLD